MVPAGYGRLRLLFVDDALPTRIMLRELLRCSGLEHVSIVDDATIAFEAIKTHTPDVVFTDWEMPGRSGLDLLRDIREHPESPDPFLAVVLLTAKDRQDQVLCGRNAGATGYMIKPIKLGGIVERIGEAITRPRAFIVSASGVGPDMRRARMPGEQEPLPLPEGSVIIPPDYLLAAKVKGDRVALSRAWEARQNAIAMVRRIFRPHMPDPPAVPEPAESAPAS